MDDSPDTAFERFRVVWATGSSGPDLKVESGRRAIRGSGNFQKALREVLMETDQILKAAREIVGSVKTALAITVDPAGIAQARGVWTGPLEPDWTLRFCTRRRTRKVADIERTGHLTMALSCGLSR